MIIAMHGGLGQRIRASDKVEAGFPAALLNCYATGSGSTFLDYG
jgi:hypothetical protein